MSKVLKRDVLLGTVNMLGGYIFGYNTGVVAGVLTILSGESKDNSVYLPDSMQGIFTASILLGALLGSMVGGPIADKFGRKAGVITLSLVTLVFASLLAIANTLNTVIAARSFLGIGVGMSGVICPMYVSETASPKAKGPLGILFQLAITIGIFVAYVINYALEDIKYNWRVMFGLGAAPGLILFLLGLAMPESPVWLVTRSKNGEGTPLIGTNEPETPLGVRLALFIKSRALYIGIVLAVAQQLTGINAFMYYAKPIFSAAKIDNPNYPTMVLGAWNAVSTLFAVPLVSKFGRRTLLLSGNIIMSIACVGLGLSYQFATGSTLGILAVTLLLVFVFAFEISDGPLFWVVAQELFTPEIKTVGASTLNALQWLFNITLTLGFPVLQKLIHETVFYIFGIIGVVCILIMAVALPETRPKEY